MKHLALTLCLALALPAHAGGPVLEGTVEESTDLVAGDRDRNGALLPILLGIGILAIIASGGGGSDVCNGEEGPGDPGAVC